MRKFKIVGRLRQIFPERKCANLRSLAQSEKFAVGVNGISKKRLQRGDIPQRRVKPDETRPTNPPFTNPQFTNFALPSHHYAANLRIQPRP
jgi:hypothetical protein